MPTATDLAKATLSCIWENSVFAQKIVEKGQSYDSEPLSLWFLCKGLIKLAKYASANFRQIEKHLAEP